MTSSQPDNPSSSITAKGVYGHLPKGIWVLGFVSMFMDISSELVHSLLPIFMTSMLGASMATVGIIEGVAEGTAAITKVFSGAISDYFGKRKFLAVIGYALGSLAKPVFPLATTIGWVFAARFIDRIGKGIRGAPRDALVADITPPQLRGAAYGLRQALDSVGAFLGPLLAVACMIWFTGDLKAVLWVAVLPAVIAVFLLIFGLREPVRSTIGTTGLGKNLAVANAGKLSLRYWLVVALGALFALARFSEAFLLLRARDLGLAAAYVPVIMMVMNLFYSFFAYPAGAAADRFSVKSLMTTGLWLLVAADIVFAGSTSLSSVFIGAALWGLHMAFSQGLLAKLVADTTPAGLLGTAFGIFHFVSGIALLLASVIAGALWDAYGAPATFIAGGGFATLAALGLLLYRPPAPDTGHRGST